MNIKIKGRTIKLGQFLKKIGITDTGGHAKVVIENSLILINKKKPNGRSSKIRPGDIVWINDEVYYIDEEK